MADFKHALCVILVHGLHGTEDDWKYFEQSLEDQFPNFTRQHASMSDMLFCLRSKNNGLFKTHEGLEKMGSRLSEEVKAFMLKDVIPQLFAELEDAADGGKKWLLHFTVVGHSLGGLISRMALPSILESMSSMLGPDVQLFSASQTTDSVEARVLINPCTYLSISTPHLGSRRPRPASGADIITDPWNAIISHGQLAVCSSIVGKTGRELVLIDAKDDVNASHLMRLSLPDTQYMQALSRFTNRTTVGHSQDFTVPASSSLMAPHLKHNQSVSAAEKFCVTGLDGVDQGYRSEFSDIVAAATKAVQTDLANSVMSRFYDDRVFDNHDIQHLFDQDETLEVDVVLTAKANEEHEPESLSLSFNNGNEVEYNSKMLQHLNSLPWKRILVNYNCDRLWRYTVHAVMIGKDMPIVPASMKKLGQQSTDFMVRLILVDYILERRRRQQCETAITESHMGTREKQILQSLPVKQ